MKLSTARNYYNQICKTALFSCKSVYIYGAGQIGNRIAVLFDSLDLQYEWIDQDVSKWGCKIRGRQVHSPDVCKIKPLNAFIIIAVKPETQKEIARLLDGFGLMVNNEYVTYDLFLREYFPVYMYETNKKVFMDLCQICLTERCTLKCKKCAHGCFAVKPSSEDMQFSNVKYTVDMFFSRVNYIHEFVLIGGEPLLYKQLTDVIRYIGLEYRNRICLLTITTNGTIMPSDELIETCRRYGVLFRVSDYSSSLPKLKPRYEKLRLLLSDNELLFKMEKSDSWIDYGFGTTNRKASDDELIKVFDNCRTNCREVRYGNLYQCVMARSVSDNLGIKVGYDDYFDLKENKNDRELVYYLIGGSKRGFLSMCDYCNGMNCGIQIPVAEQIED